jgi:hypothetical protein
MTDLSLHPMAHSFDDHGDVDPKRGRWEGEREREGDR